MRAGPSDEVLAGFPGWAPTVASWRGGTLLESAVPITSGKVTASVTQAVPERLTITVPRFANGTDWRPGDDAEHPLARFGQELQVSVVVVAPSTKQTWQVQVGRFLIVDWDDDDQGQIQVVAEGLLRRVADDKLTAPSQPAGGATLASEARRLLPAGMGAGFDTALVDRACPSGMTWSEDRLSALQEIADAWPALLRTDEWGQVQFKAPLVVPPVPVVHLTDGPTGTAVTVPRSDTRSGAYNRVVARSAASGAEDVQAVVDQASGPMAVSGPYGVVTRVWSSPLLTTQAECAAAAATMLSNSLLPAQTLPVTCAPDPRIDLDDPVSVTRGGVVTWGWVTGYELPLTVRDGAMRVDVGVAS